MIPYICPMVAFSKERIVIIFVFCIIYLLPLTRMDIYSQSIGINTTGATPTTASMLEILQTGTTANSYGIYSLHSGGISGTGYSGFFSKTGGSTTNVGGYFSATGATNNYAGIFENGFVGIGTVTPGYLFHVYSNTGGSGTEALIETGTTNWSGFSAKNANRKYFVGIPSGGTDRFAIVDNTVSLERVSMLSNGNFGIGNNLSPGYLLHVYKDGAGCEVMSETNTTNAAGYLNKNNNRTYFTGIPSGTSNWTLRDNSAAADRITVLSDGRVGINTSPNDIFEVLASGGRGIILGGGATTGSEIKLTYSAAQHYSIYNSGNGFLTFANTSSLYATNTAATTVLGTFDADGDFSVNQTIKPGNLSSDPSGSNGMIYYNTSSGKFRGYENGSWKDMVVSAGNSNWSVKADIAFSRDDISGWSTASSGDEVSTSVNIPFNFVINGTNYTWVSLCTNGYIQFNTSNSSFATDYTNNALPSADFSVPTLCFYWDDMQTTGNGIRYNTLGDAGNRTFYADFELVVYGTANQVTAQVQIHEGSNLINIRYYSNNPSAIGQSATIGFQLSGSSALPISCNAMVLDDNSNPQSISFCPGK